ncbi:MAG: SWIM zinc finger family protein [Deltaproteobacteria bacterium]|nr:SWIM zinc finger family protein [Deltaproteobacteria bacterium]
MRDDLLALGPEALAALANVGLVKRATKEIEAGKLPVVEESDDGTVVARFDDGVVARLPVGKSLRDAPCTCPSTSVCRHRIALVLAYQRSHGGRPESTADAEPKAPPPSPATISDEALRAHLAPRAWEKATSARRAGYSAEVRRRGDPTVGLSTCTVRFLAGDALGFARCDCAAGGGCEHVALAVWALRAAELRDPSGLEEGVVEVGERSRTAGGAASLGAGIDVAREVLLEGVIHLSSAFAGTFARAREPLVAAGLTWPADALDDLEAELSAYRARSARYAPEHVAWLVMETVARERAARRGGALPSRVVLGQDEAPETKLDHVRLISLGARLSADGRERSADVLLCDPDTATILVLQRRFTYGEKETPEDGFALAHRSVSKGVRLGQVAAGQVVTTVARRRANRALLLGQGGVSRTTVTPQPGHWEILPHPVRVESIEALDAALRDRPPRMIRPRHLAEGVVVVAVGAVEGVSWVPSEQRLHARLSDATGRSFELRLTHRSVAPFAVDALAAALSATEPIRFVSGLARRAPTGVVIEPLAVVTDRVIVLDLAQPDDAEASSPLRSGASFSIGGGATSALDDALDGVGRTVSDAAHVGLRHLTDRFPEDVDRAATKCREVGLRAVAARLTDLAAAHRAFRVSASAESENRVLGAWVDTAIRLAVLRENV